MAADNKKFSQIKYLVIDVDGTLTDAGIYYDETGNELKKFCTKDAAGLFAAHAAGIKYMILTGRECAATARRLKEMKADYVVQNCKDKIAYLREFIEKEKISFEEIGYLGDDLNDYTGMKLAGYAGCPADACEEIKGICDYVSSVKGGHGAVRDIISYLLKQRGEWEKAISDIYGAGI
ncbi:MAG: HAD hydrolase family protein [Lachnospiraceae bacterium]|nr:HAD hydrolase family protein [Lachnospiraceae bacterium]